MRKPATLLLLALVFAGAACQGHAMDASKAFPDPAVAALAQAADCCAAVVATADILEALR